MSLTFDPYALRNSDVRPAADVILTNPTILNELEAYWASLPRQNGVPKRKHVDPVTMGSLLEDTFILEHVAPGVARMRVAGRNIGKLLGYEPRGLPLTAAFVPNARAAISNHIETAFGTPAITQIPLRSPRALAQPLLNGKLLLLPLVDDHGQVSRMLGALVMSGRRGIGGRRFAICDTAEPRIDPVLGLHAVSGGKPKKTRPSLRMVRDDKTQVKPALRLVVSNP